MARQKKWQERPWSFKKPSINCETLVQGDHPCGKLAFYAYAALGGGYHSMCRHHVIGFENISVTIERAKQGHTAPPTARKHPPTTTERGE